MTDAEIDKMEAGPELDALVAEKVMRWERCNLATPLTWRKQDGSLITHEPTSFGAFQPSTNIAAAWEVLRRIKSMNYEVKCDFGIYLNPSLTWDYSYVDFLNDLDVLTPINICRAALKSVMENPNA